ncbi:tRNA pseudouridine synthase B [Mycoavidus cysteinexigens]|uniref:tRNA pseudouridine synthase B n=2 Tax=Mycoavidus cysteinexigens TaxID=1553431 RepID=A0A2Z6EVR4_9BURK|nr:tRNA pseudouridine synthase B [Mycoavidus cysteinexigens]GAM51687.1 tRNA pseudouridine synthase B [bacterium endosymbiont of Mortierella elongata FMR23-6]GLR01068.1 tRNA pseudouridine synthase B [Mycoavidus cysteinexigens]
MRLIVNQHYQFNPVMALPIQPSKPARHALDGVLLLDKPLGLSSNEALVRAKRLLLAKKAGHTGTLDPLASGLLPLCFGEATKFSNDLLNASKAYEATVVLGACTTTADAEGEIIQSRPVKCELKAVHEALARFRGEIWQIPPMYSALKRDGKPLYEYARAGLTLERAARPVTIEKLELISCTLPVQAQTDPLAMATGTLQIRVQCSKGTYIRVLAQDIGEALGCGAYLGALRRTGVGLLKLADAISLEALTSTDHAARLAYLQPTDTLLSTYSTIQLTPALAHRFKQGQRLPTELVSESTHSNLPAPVTAALVRVYDETSQFLGTARLTEKILAPERLIANQ